MCIQVAANAIEWTSASVASSSSHWPAKNAVDGMPFSIWSSTPHGSADFSEYFAFWFPSYQFNKVNYVKLTPRFHNNKAIGFPRSFSIYYSNGTDWIKSHELKDFPVATRVDDLILPLPTTVSANGILIQATTLGNDGVGNYVFQLGEVRAGYEPTFETKLRFLHNDKSLPDQNEIRNAGSGKFDPNKLSEWHNDVRWPLIKPRPGMYRNIYAPTIIKNETTSWNIYFGGHDGEKEPLDQVYMTVSPDNFLTFNTHSAVIKHGDFDCVNNPSAIKNGTNSWAMMITTANCAELPYVYNKPMLATSTNGNQWTPNIGQESSLITINGYSNWKEADINGCNVIYDDGMNGIHLYFCDFLDVQNNVVKYHVTHHAISYDRSSNFYYQGIAQDWKVAPERIVNDMKAFNYNGSKVYLLLTHDFHSNIHLTWSKSLSRFPAHQVALTNKDDSDKYIVSEGFVSDGMRLFGILYGAGSASTLDENRIFGRWLQKKIIFQNDHVRWGDVEEAYGPDRVRLYMDTKVETGNFYVYDTDGKTLLYISPRVTMRSGDVWKLLSM